MKKADIIKSWYPNEVLSDDEALAIYDRLLKLYLPCKQGVFAIGLSY